MSSKKKGTTWFRHAYKVISHYFWMAMVLLTPYEVPHPPENKRCAETPQREFPHTCARRFGYEH